MPPPSPASAPPVVLTHGLLAADHRVARWDRRGYGALAPPERAMLEFLAEVR